MNKVLSCLLGVFTFGGLCSCDESSNKLAPPMYESTSLVQLNQSNLISAINWDVEREFLQSDRLFELSAKAVGGELSDLKKSVSFEIQESENLVLIRAVHADPENARFYAEKTAAIYLKARNDREVQVAQKNLATLNAQLEEQEAEVYRRREELSVLLDNLDLHILKKETAIETLERDRLTYEKAKKALEREVGEDQERLENLEIPKDLLFERPAEK